MIIVEKEISDLRKKMEEIKESFQKQLNAFHLGKASANLVESLKVSYFGQDVPLNSLANVSVVDILNLILEPYDPKSKTDIVQGLKKAKLSCSITEEGERIRLTFPPLSEERKEEMIKLLKQKKEEFKISLRLKREEVWDRMQEMKAKGEINEEDKIRVRKELDKIISEFNLEIDKLAQDK